MISSQLSIFFLALLSVVAAEKGLFLRNNRKLNKNKRSKKKEKSPSGSSSDSSSDSSSSDSSSSDSSSSDDTGYLSVDLRGEWVGGFKENCEGFIIGLLKFQGQDPAMIPPQQLQGMKMSLCNRPFTQYIFQDCLKMTITGGDVVHTMVLDGTYVTDDFHFSGLPAAWQSVIEKPSDEEAADGASATVVFYGYDKLTSQRIGPAEGLARRYINSEGDLVFSQDLDIQGTGNGTTKGVWLMKKQADIVGCTAYDAEDELCSEKQYTDTNRDWTSACCENKGGDAFLESLLNSPRPPPYVAYGYGVAPGWMPCRL